MLEFGCGTGSTALVHAARVKHILAIDISSKMIEIARAKAEANHVTNITFRRAAIDEFTAPDASFDAVLGHSILHLLEDRDSVIAKVHGMLKPGGVFISSTACIADTIETLQTCRAGRQVPRGLSAGEGVHHTGAGGQPGGSRVRDRASLAPRQRQGRVHRGEEAGLKAHGVTARPDAGSFSRAWRYFAAER